jgi:pimeloyl-ACP methyl ester carboxylesterase
MEVEIEALNADPTPLEQLDVDTIVDHYEAIIRGLDSPPIIMGHSFGGALTQILLDRGVGAVGVGIAPATVKGVRDLPLSTLKSSAPLLAHPFKKYGGLDEKQFHYAFANFMRHAAMAVDFENARAPMLFIAFSEDHVVPPKLIHDMAEKYTAVPVEYKEFPDRPHFPGVPGWEEVADYALTWAVEHASTKTAPPAGVATE